MEFTNEMIEKAKQAADPEELRAMAKEEGIELSAEDAEKYFAFLQGGNELPDEALEAVAGGKGKKYPDAKYHAGQTIRFLFQTNTFYKAKILSLRYVELQKGWYYGIKTMDTGDENNGKKYSLALELPVFRTQVIG